MTALAPTSASSPDPDPATARPPDRDAGLGALRFLPLLCVVLPLLAYLGVGVYRYQEIRQQTDQRLDRALRIANEHALRVMDTTESLLARVQDLAAAPLPDLEANRARLHAQLQAMAANKPQLHGIWVFGPAGRTVVTSRFAQPPAADISDRDYFAWHRDGRGGIHVSQLHVGKVTQQVIFDVSMMRREADGRFGGVVAVSLLPAYFAAFHKELAADEPGLAITMLREDGTVYSRWPPLEGAPERLSPGSPVMSSIRQGSSGAKLRGVSSIDGRMRLLAFQQVGHYPIYVGTGMDVAEIRNEWLEEMAWLAAFGIPPMLGLFIAARLALRRSQEAMESARRLAEETDARRRVEEALLQAQKLEALGRLTGGVAHDFNNALMVISNNLVLLRMKHPETVGRFVDSMSRAVGSATKLTRQLLAFSRRQAMVPEHIDLQERLPMIQDLIAPVLGGQVAFSVDIAPDVRPIRVDAAEFELALLNLAINARDAMGRDGRFGLHARNAQPEELPPLLHGPMVVVEAADTGSGVSPEILAKVFEPFFTTKPVGHGTGLGLSQVYGLCHRAGGLATLESTVGVGTVVRMFFPPDTEEDDRSEPPVSALGRDLDLRVLMVEDNEEVAGALTPLLEALGCNVVVLHRAAEARDWLARQRELPDLLLTDVVMPGEIDGLALARHARVHRPGLKIILMTGYAEQVDAMTREGFEILPKPCSPEMLVEAIDRVMREG